MAAVRRATPLLAMALSDHRNLRGQPMSFETMPYLPALYARVPDMSGADIVSAVQTGKSELLILLSLYQAGWKGRVVAYVLPTFKVRSRFVTRRIDPLLAEVPAYHKRLPGGEAEEAVSDFASRGKGSQALKRFGAGTLLYLGSNSETDFLEFSADTMIIDEWDACDKVNLVRAKDRIVQSPYPQLFRVGNPTDPPGTPGSIDSLYGKSDGRRWYYKCPHCNEKQPLDWFVNFVRRTDDGHWLPRDDERHGHAVISFGGGLRVVAGDLRPYCRRCSKPFERAEAWHAWVAENPGLGRREGYRMTRLDVLSQSMRELFAEWVAAQGDTNALARFFASALGMAYEAAGSQITVGQLQDACTGKENDLVGGPEYKDEMIVMGVDVGTVLNVTIDAIRYVSKQESDADANEALVPGLRRVAVHIGGYSNFEDLEDLIERFHVQVCCIDARPETRKCQELRDKMQASGKCDVWLCQFFAVARVGRQRFGMQLSWRDRVVSCDRTQLLDASFDDIRFHRREFPSDTMSIRSWSDQMRAPKRMLDEARARVVWTEGNAADHARFSDAYALVALELSQSGGTYSAG